MVLIGTTGDPAMPLEWAESLAAAFAPAVLVVREGEGHVAYPTSACVRALVNAYLIDQAVPAAGTRCA